MAQNQKLFASTEWPAEDDPRYWEKLRKEFLLNEDEVFLNTATIGSSPRIVLETMNQNALQLAATVAQWDYNPDHPRWISGYFEENPLRQKLSALIHADIEEVALTQNATMGMNFIAMGLDLKAGDEIIQTNQEHPGGESGWKVRAKRHNVVIRNVQLPVPATDPEQIVQLVRDAITPKTRVIAWPHITSALGTIQPVQQICKLAKEKGIFSVLDGAQAIGHISIHLKEIDCDAYFSSPHKWLLAPVGNGLLYVRKSFAQKVWTTLASTQWENETDPGYRLQQRGTGSVSLLVGLEAAIDFHNKVGSDRWIRRIKQLGDYLRASLQKIDRVKINSSVHPEMCAGITTWSIDGIAPAKIQEIFWEKAKMRPRAVDEHWGVRTSTMIYNNEKELDRFLEITQEIAKT